MPKTRRQEEQTNFVGWRLTLLCDCILLALIFLLGRVAWPQVVSLDVLVRQGDMRSLRIREVSTACGMITDRSRWPLAVSVPVKAIWANSRELHDAGGVTLDTCQKTLADALNMPLDQLTMRINTNPQMRFIYLAHQVSPSMADYIEKLKLLGIHLHEESRRYHPSGEVTAHLTGFTNVDSQGIKGVERNFDKWLTGQPGERIVCKDRYGRVIEDTSSTDSQAVYNLVLSTGERLQTLVYRKLSNAVAFDKVESGSTVLVDASTGEVLVIAGSPSYSPNSFASAAKDTMRSRTTTDIFEPGSTVKPMVVMTALQHGIVNEDTVLNTTPYRVNGHKIKDVVRYSGLTLIGVLQKSGNIGVSRLALVMPSSALVNTYSRFGLGKATNLGLVGECSSLYPQKQRWSGVERIIFSFGYGLVATPLQLTRVHVTIGSYGIYRPLSVTEVDPSVPGGRVFPESFVCIVVHMMEGVVLPDGGGMKAAIRGCCIAIKTGTVKKVGSDGRYISKYIAYTAGIAPASRLYFVLVVVINDPQAGRYYGGAVPAPVFGTIMSGVLCTVNIEPDALATGKKNELAINQGEGTDDRSQLV